MTANSDPVMSLPDDVLSSVPIAKFHGALQICPMMAVKVCEDPILVL